VGVGGPVFRGSIFLELTNESTSLPHRLLEFADLRSIIPGRGRAGHGFTPKPLPLLSIVPPRFLWLSQSPMPPFPSTSGSRYVWESHISTPEEHLHGDIWLQRWFEAPQMSLEEELLDLLHLFMISHDMAYHYEEHTKYHGVDAGVQRSLWHETSIQGSLVRNLESISDWDHLLVDVLHKIRTVDRSRTESH
jgi:hypothetical protein